MFDTLLKLTQKPKLYEKSTAKFWNDPHISKSMLVAHLNSTLNSATRKYDFVDTSVEWISSIVPPENFPKVLDLGCGPGIYAEKFHEKSYDVTGVDFSERSIAYAEQSRSKKGYTIRYLCQDYLELSAENEFDSVTLIYCDFGVLSPQERRALLKLMYRALKSGGVLIFDVFTPKYHEGEQESKDWASHEKGFYSERQHICLDSFYRYESDNTVLNQSIIITNETVQCYNIWEHMFTADELTRDLHEAGFSETVLYGDIAGAKYSEESTMICAVAKK